MSYVAQPTIKPHKTVSFKNYYNKQKKLFVLYAADRIGISYTHVINSNLRRICKQFHCINRSIHHFIWPNCGRAPNVRAVMYIFERTFFNYIIYS